WPKRVQPGSVNHQLVCFTDVLATLAELVDLPLSDQAAPDSFSFLDSLLSKEVASSRESLAMRTGSGLWTVRLGSWKLIAGLGSGGFSKPSRIKATSDGPQGQLYDLSKDPTETTNLYLQRPSKVAELSEELDRLRSLDVTRDKKVR
ncbi:MAG: arylsulfatase, partial [Rubripirellula sp.]